MVYSSRGRPFPWTNKLSHWYRSSSLSGAYNGDSQGSGLVVCVQPPHDSPEVLFLHLGSSFGEFVHSWPERIRILDRRVFTRVQCTSSTSFAVNSCWCWTSAHTSFDCWWSLTAFTGLHGFLTIICSFYLAFFDSKGYLPEFTVHIHDILCISLIHYVGIIVSREAAITTECAEIR